MRSFITLIGGTASAQLIAIAASPLLSRLFSAEDFGYFAIYAGVLYFVNAFSSFRLEVAALAVADNESCELLFSWALFFLLMVTLISVPIGSIAALLCDQSLLLWGGLMPASILFLGMYSIQNSAALRAHSIGAVSIGRFAQSGGGVLLQLLLGGLGLGLTGLITGQLLGLIVGAVAIGILVRKTKWNIEIGSLFESKSLSVFKLNSENARYDSVATAANVAANHLPMMLIASMLGSALGGLFFMAYRVLVIPSGVVAQAVSQVISAKYHHWESRSYAGQGVARILIVLLVLVVPPFFVFGLVSERAFAVVLGEGWRTSGIIAAWCGLWMGFKFVYDSVAIFVSLSGRQKIGMYFQWSLLALRVLAIVIGSITLDPIDTIKLFCIISAVVYLSGIIMVYVFAKGYIALFVKSLIFVVALSAVFYAASTAAFSQASSAADVIYVPIAIVSLICWLMLACSQLVTVRKLLS